MTRVTVNIGTKTVSTSPLTVEERAGLDAVDEDQKAREVAARRPVVAEFYRGTLNVARPDWPTVLWVDFPETPLNFRQADDLLIAGDDGANITDRELAPLDRQRSIAWDMGPGDGPAGAAQATSGPVAWETVFGDLAYRDAAGICRDPSAATFTATSAAVLDVNTGTVRVDVTVTHDTVASRPSGIVLCYTDPDNYLLAATGENAVGVIRLQRVEAGQATSHGTVPVADWPGRIMRMSATVHVAKRVLTVTFGAEGEASTFLRLTDPADLALFGTTTRHGLFTRGKNARFTDVVVRAA